VVVIRVLFLLNMNRIKLSIALLLTILCFCNSSAFAQTIPQNMSPADINNLSDTQLKQYMQRAQASGMTDEQAIKTAQSNGMSPEQIQKLRLRVAGLRAQDGTATSADSNVINLSRHQIIAPEDTMGENDKTTTSSRIFGANLFRNNSNKTFEPNLKLATPVNYILGPDDELRISVYGNSLADWNLAVSPEGNINIPGAGVLKVAGKTIEQATAAIKNKLITSNYAIGKGTKVEVSLGNIRSIKVILQGQLIRPGTYTLTSLSSVFNALYAAHGPNDIGSFRDIQIIRNNRIIRHLDLYDFLVKGSQKDNITLRDQDIIRVPTYGIRVGLSGEVKLPALFEVLPGETIQDVINFSGGFTDQAYTARIKAVQVSERQRKIIDIVETDYKSYTPLRGDQYTVDKILDRYENRVNIEGAVFRPGDFELQKGLTISQLIKNAGGLKEDAFTGRGSIIRLNADNTTQQISFNVMDAMSNPSADIALQREDNVFISSLFDLRNKYNVTIKGEVRKPGEFAYADSMKIADLIIKAGGFDEGASTKRIEVSRRIFNSDPSLRNSTIAQVFYVNVDAALKEGDVNFTLKPFDIVSVYSLPGYETQKVVKVEGEVIYPGYYTIQKKDEKISDIIVRAGGLTASADADGGNLKRNNTAVLGVDKAKIDTIALNAERSERLKLLHQTTINDSSQFRNNYIGIDLKKILKKSGTSDDLILEDGDVLRIPKQLQTVRVNGEVLYPSAVVYSSQKSFRGYVYNAGGFSPKALKRGAYVVYPNGTVKATTKILFFNVHPSVKPGSEIFVPTKPAVKSNTIQEILGFTTGLASLGAIILGIISINK
jgi:protein involved in polysaccharide export with SLBB domain